jgi:hypothetical protein
VENEDKTACEKIRVEFDANWWTFWDEHIHIVNSVTPILDSGSVPWWDLTDNVLLQYGHLDQT